MPNTELAEWYTRYHRLVFARCLRYLRNPQDAMDAMQDVFIKAQQQRSSFKGAAAPLTWLTRIAINHCLNRLRDARLHKSEEVRRGIQSLTDNVTPVSDPVRRLLILAVLAQLDEQTREIAALRYLEEATLEEIATITGRSIPTLRKRLAQFEIRARALLEDRGSAREAG